MSTGSPSSQESPVEREYDPVFLNSRREAIIILCVWIAAMLWTVPCCYLSGYGQPIDPENLDLMWGVPSWIFWGVVAPWLVADLFTVWFCFFYMVDDDLGEAHEGADLEGEISERAGSSQEQKASDA